MLDGVEADKRFNVDTVLLPRNLTGVSGEFDSMFKDLVSAPYRQKIPIRSTKSTRPVYRKSRLGNDRFSIKMVPMDYVHTNSPASFEEPVDLELYDGSDYNQVDLVQQAVANYRRHKNLYNVVFA